MTHGRKPRKPRPINANALKTALYRATCLTEDEIRETIAPARRCFDRMREGVATEDQHTVLHTCMQIALAIEASGIVRGLREHLDSAMAALGTIHARAMTTGTWRPTSLYFHELDALRDAVDLHYHQLRLLSAGELQAITAKLIARTHSAGGMVMRANAQTLGLAA
ncbi:hypothetical protein [Acidovorax sp. NCPPB 4044]|uniref:hypothetical protein n=1 Tax=Acidovorax sp. NCPPB 4044 TaxID=2940490 RepID=UPI002303F1B8|nr:hypothetical protein [Acidovorax sp. NCPPB 4044]MDA8522340.1 hypothetical protein [Acidovorax sp. NCPPB 4044]